MKNHLFRKILLGTLILSTLSFTSCNSEEKSSENPSNSSPANSESFSYVSNDENKSQAENSSAEESSSLIEINPFEGILIEVTDVSPYCKIVIDTENCDSFCHSGVKYSTDKERYSSGEEATVTASFSSPRNSKEYVLTQTEFKYTIPTQAEFITSADGVDIKLFQETIDNYIIARNAESIGNYWFWSTTIGSLVDSYKTIEPPKLEKIYFISVRKNYEQNNLSNYYSAYSNVDRFNCFNLIYTFNTTTRKGVNSKVYVNIIVPNVIRETDGSIKWGKASQGDLKLNHYASSESMDFLITSTILKYSESYKITEIEINK